MTRRNEIGCVLHFSLPPSVRIDFHLGFSPPIMGLARLLDGVGLVSLEFGFGELGWCDYSFRLDT